MTSCVEWVASCAQKLTVWSLPSNAQLDGWLDKVTRFTGSVDLKSVSGDARAVIDNFNSLVDTVRKLVREKNGDELAQETFWMAWCETRAGSGRPFTHPSTRPADPYNRDKGTRIDIGCVSPSCSPGRNCGEPGESAVEGSIEDDLARDVDAAARDQGEKDGELREAVGHLRTLAAILFTNPQLRAACITELATLARRQEAEGDGDPKPSAQCHSGEATQTEMDARENDNVGGSPDGPESPRNLQDANDRVEDTELANAEVFHIPGAYESDDERDYDVDDDVVVDADTSPAVTLAPRVASFLQTLRKAM